MSVSVTPGVAQDSPALRVLDLLSNPDEAKKQISDFETRRQAAEAAEKRAADALAAVQQRERAVTDREKSLTASESQLTALRASVEAKQADVTMREEALAKLTAETKASHDARAIALTNAEAELQKRQSALESRVSDLPAKEQALADAQATFAQAKADVDEKVKQTKAIWA